MCACRVRRQLADTIPDKYRVAANSDQRCVLCGVQSALDVLQNTVTGEMAGGHVIVVTRGDRPTLSITDENKILDYAINYNVKFSSVSLPDAAGGALPFYDMVAAESGGRAFQFPVENVDDVGAHLYSRSPRKFIG